MFLKFANSSFKSVIVLLTFLLFFAACKEEDDDAPAPQTITDIVIANPDFSLLEAAIVKASTVENLAGLLSGTGPFTVFAPSNAAFAASGITQATIDALPAAELVRILKYHVLSGRVTAAQVTTGPVNTALPGDIFLTKETNGGVTINGAIDFSRVRVVQADVAASNGIIHVVDKVILPNTIEDLVVALSGLPAGQGRQFTLLAAAITRAGLLGVLDGTGPFTVFAPTDAAFQAAGFADVAAINAAAPATLSNILRYHIIGGNAKVYAAQVQNNATVNMLNGGTVVTKTASGGVQVDATGAAIDSNVVIANVTAPNGVVHVIDRVLLP